ncbi:glycosylation-dependent cell adhesion molecule 1 [Fukomys damarensis]|uniref:glycosylation-dependent cell adhesion molecule 1 n=1 Tax=Fukomys damarensis TaxID=885580 RepID=UPI0005402190|nr:glycosylation-dependent cell adhesion molecule 1 [Fukomys damarensis]
MKVSTVLLLASLASTSLAILHAAQFLPTNHPRKDHVSNEDLSKEPSIIKEELISKENVEIKSTRPKSQKSMQPEPILPEESLRNAHLQSEEITEPTPRAGKRRKEESSWGGIKKEKGKGKATLSGK